MPRRPRALLALIATAAAVEAAGCGGSTNTGTAKTSTATGAGSATTKPAYCADVANLKASINALPQTKVVQNGVSGLESAVAQIKKDTQAVVTSVKGQFTNETSALQSSVQTLGTTAKHAAASPSVATLTQLPGQVSAVVTEAKNLEKATSPKCG